MIDQPVRRTVPDEGWLDHFDDGPELSLWNLLGPQPEGRIDLAVRPYTPYPDGLGSLDPSRLVTLHLQTRGFDGELPAGIICCNAVGVHEGSTAELTVALLVAPQHNLDVYVRKGAEWKRRWGTSVADRRVILLGYDGTGTKREAARRPWRPARTRRRPPSRGRARPDLLPTVDVVLVAVPLRRHHRADRRSPLNALLAHAVVVNVSRGKVAHTDAIVRQAGRIRYAPDVADPEALPADHPLWSEPGVLIYPHVGGRSSATQPSITRVVRDQIDRLLNGEPLAAVVIPAEGSKGTP